MTAPGPGRLPGTAPGPSPPPAPHPPPPPPPPHAPLARGCRPRGCRAPARRVLGRRVRYVIGDEPGQVNGMRWRPRTPRAL
ncbi:tryptophan biosynthesis modulator TrpM [Streptomyces sp. CBMA291]|uniref:tryptophan biosynthesis modulator TrpM n=2 Tax=unclassified Streptomyces TaxID=2593676 RepID=UPI001DA1EC9C|nr:tryptophan synthase subunit(beta) [Streptomyces sp. CBMA291]